MRSSRLTSPLPRAEGGALVKRASAREGPALDSLMSTPTRPTVRRGKAAQDRRAHCLLDLVGTDEVPVTADRERESGCLARAWAGVRVCVWPERPRRRFLCL